jgi:hypothetical protein
LLSLISIGVEVELEVLWRIVVGADSTAQIFQQMSVLEHIGINLQAIKSLDDDACSLSIRNIFW